jgi:hypothetical protein
MISPFNQREREREKTQIYKIIFDKEILQYILMKFTRSMSNMLKTYVLVNQKMWKQWINF